MNLPKPDRTDSLGSKVFGILRDEIFSGRFTPGQSLREQALAKAMSVSQGTVREALGQLEQVGLVQRVPHCGTTVTDLASQEIRDRLQVRLLLEQQAFSEAAQCMSEQDCQRLEGLAAKIAAALEANSHYEVSQADLDFHRFVWTRSGNAVRARLLDQICTPLFAFVGMLRRAAFDDQSKTHPHEPLVEALRTRDPKRARAAIRDHINGSYSFVEFAKQPKLEERTDALVGTT